ncbi:hypothetical protein OIU79_029850 [Salix purpurea]|uniref:Pentatricopeptide repeat-containing protein n=1 Tax=Salix purpurea TaxID=77065 RepID=A0A9Q0VHS1_SALPP|nr:hypothetical protein OIU79_029850 [Salix purpurea]
MFCHARSLLRRPNITLTTTILRTLTTVGAATYPEIPLLQESTSYTVTPPIKPWPQRLYPKRLISMITHQDNLDLAFQVFDYAGKYHPGFSHTHATYHSIIDKLSRARAFDAVESLLSQLSRSSSHIKCGGDVFISVIRNYGLAGRPRLALKTFTRIKGEFSMQPSVKLLNTLLNVFVQNKSFNILIKALCKKNDVENALKVFDEMPTMGMIPNLVTYTTILGGFVSRGDLVNAEKVFSEIFDKGWSPDAITYTVLMVGYCKQGRLSDAIKVMDNMEYNGMEPNEITYGVMIDAYCKEKRSGEARNLIDDMLDKKFLPSSTLCCKVIDVLCEDGKVENACHLWKRMLDKNCLPDNAIMSTLIHWLCKEGKVWEARKLFDEFERSTIPSLMTYNTLIAGMCERGELNEAGRLWDDMVEKRRRPNAFTYNMLIKGFTKAGNVKEGIRILEEMLDNGCLPNKSTYTLLIEGLQELGMEGDVDKVVSMAMASIEVDADSWDLFLHKIVGNLDCGTGALDRLLMENAT